MQYSTTVFSRTIMVLNCNFFLLLKLLKMHVTANNEA